MTGYYFGAQVAVRRTHHALATDASVKVSLVQAWFVVSFLLLLFQLTSPLFKIWHDEMELLSQLRHPNVVSFYGAALELHAPMMTVTELCEGTVQELVS